jgi:hypothetical protein
VPPIYHDLVENKIDQRRMETAGSSVIVKSDARGDIMSCVVDDPKKKLSIPKLKVELRVIGGLPLDCLRLSMTHAECAHLTFTIYNFLYYLSVRLTLV